MFSNKTLIAIYTVASLFLWYDFLRYRLPLTEGPTVSLNRDRRMALKMTVNAINKPEHIFHRSMHIEHLHHIPALKMRWMMARLLPCLSKIKIRNNTASTEKDKAQAWVFPHRWGEKTVWINGLVWDDFPRRTKARALIHECTHLVLKTLDYAYVHQDKYGGLRGSNATYNADSITELIDILNYF